MAKPLKREHHKESKDRPYPKGTRVLIVEYVYGGKEGTVLARTDTNSPNSTNWYEYKIQVDGIGIKYFTEFEIRLADIQMKRNTNIKRGRGKVSNPNISSIQLGDIVQAITIFHLKTSSKGKLTEIRDGDRFIVISIHKTEGAISLKSYRTRGLITITFNLFKDKFEYLGYEGLEKIKNPGTFEEVSELSRKFHGRDVQNISEAFESESYDTNLAGLGELVELEILIDEDTVIPINWEGSKNRPQVCCNASGDNIEFVGGDQSLDLEELQVAELEIETNKRYIQIGEVFSISYFADKHHLTGPKSQAYGTEYIHEFGEDGGERPILVYDARDKKMKLVGGSYKVEEEGIKN